MTTVDDTDEPRSARPNGLVESYWKGSIPFDLDEVLTFVD